MILLMRLKSEAERTEYMSKDIVRRVQDYWTTRTPDFGIIRKNELQSSISGRWLDQMNAYFPRTGPLDILDAGTGTGYFAILLSKAGHRVTGIALTASMIKEAKVMAEEFDADAVFLQMDAQKTTFEGERFDVIVTRNLTWTLPDPRQAYREWHRLLRPGGLLLNFDANYADNVRHENQKASWVRPEDVYGHIGITPDLLRENSQITLSMPASRHRRPDWDREIAEEIGFSACGADVSAGAKILREKDLCDAPLFMFWAVK